MGMFVMILALKSHSYIATNYTYFTEYNTLLPIDFNQYLYFIWLASTLVYETVYPKSKRIRKTYLLKKLSIAVGGIILIYILLNQVY